LLKLANVHSVGIGYKVERGGYYRDADAAIARVLQIPVALRIQDIPQEISSISRPPSLRMLVQKRGRTTRLTHGKIIVVSVVVTSEGHTFHNQVFIQSINENLFSSGGDSGSLIITDITEDGRYQPVALLWGGAGS
jgi:hypothetical protein